MSQSILLIARFTPKLYIFILVRTQSLSRVALSSKIRCLVNFLEIKSVWLIFEECAIGPKLEDQNLANETLGIKVRIHVNFRW